MENNPFCKFLTTTLIEQPGSSKNNRSRERQQNKMPTGEWNEKEQTQARTEGQRLMQRFHRLAPSLVVTFEDEQMAELTTIAALQQELRNSSQLVATLRRELKELTETTEHDYVVAIGMAAKEREALKQQVLKLQQEKKNLQWSNERQQEHIDLLTDQIANIMLEDDVEKDEEEEQRHFLSSIESEPGDDRSAQSRHRREEQDHSSNGEEAFFLGDDDRPSCCNVDKGLKKYSANPSSAQPWMSNDRKTVTKRQSWPSTFHTASSVANILTRPTLAIPLPRSRCASSDSNHSISTDSSYGCTDRLKLLDALLNEDLDNSQSGEVLVPTNDVPITIVDSFAPYSDETKHNGDEDSEVSSTSSTLSSSPSSTRLTDVSLRDEGSCKDASREDEEDLKLTRDRSSMNGRIPTIPTSMERDKQGAPANLLRFLWVIQQVLSNKPDEQKTAEDMRTKNEGHKEHQLRWWQEKQNSCTQIGQQATFVSEAVQRNRHRRKTSKDSNPTKSPWHSIKSSLFFEGGNGDGDDDDDDVDFLEDEYYIDYYYDNDGYSDEEDPHYATDSNILEI